MAHHAQHAARAHQAAKARRILGLAAVVSAGTVAPAVARADAADRSDAALPASALPGRVPMTDPAAGALGGAATGAAAGAGQIGGLHLYPLAGTPLDVLSNNVRVPVGGLDASTFPVTAPFRDGLPLGEMPVVGALLP
jgi:hypothetical protein